MNSHHVPLLSSWSTRSWRRFALGLTLLLVSLLAFNSCGGGGDDGSGSSGGTVIREDEPVPVGDDGSGSSGGTITPENEPVPVVASCEGDIFMQAPVEAIDANTQTLTLLGLTIHVDDQTRFNNVNLEDLAVDDYVDMLGFIDVDDTIMTSCLEREEVARDVELHGPVDENGIAESRLFIMGVEVQISVNTVFEGGSLTQTEFFDQLQPGDLVSVEGQLGSIRAEEVEFGSTVGGLNDDDDNGLLDDDDDEIDDDDDGLLDDDDDEIDDDDDGLLDDDDDEIDDDDDGLLDDDDDEIDDDDNGLLDDDDDEIDDGDDGSSSLPPVPIQDDDGGSDDDDD